MILSSPLRSSFPGYQPDLLFDLPFSRKVKSLSYDLITNFRGTCFEGMISTKGSNPSMNAWSSNLMTGSYWPDPSAGRQVVTTILTWNDQDTVPQRQETRSSNSQIQFRIRCFPPRHLSIHLQVDLSLAPFLMDRHTLYSCR